MFSWAARWLLVAAAAGEELVAEAAEEEDDEEAVMVGKETRVLAFRVLGLGLRALGFWKREEGEVG